MGKMTLINKVTRIGKLSKSENEDLNFDLINAFALVKNSKDTAALLNDILIRKEV